jgi:hypothetical protein
MFHLEFKEHKSLENTTWGKGKTSVRDYILT